MQLSTVTRTNAMFCRGPHYHNELTFKISSRKVYAHTMFEVATEVLMVENGSCSVKFFFFFPPKNGLYIYIHIDKR